MLLPPSAPGLPPRGAAGARRHGRLRRRDQVAGAARRRRPLAVLEGLHPDRGTRGGDLPTQHPNQSPHRGVGRGRLPGRAQRVSQSLSRRQQSSVHRRKHHVQGVRRRLWQNRTRNREEPVVARRRTHRRTQTRARVQRPRADERTGTHLLVRRIRPSKSTQRSPVGYTAANVLWQSRRVRGPFAPEQIRTT